MKRFFTVFVLVFPQFLFSADIALNLITVEADGSRNTYILADAHKVVVKPNAMSLIGKNGQVLSSEVSCILFDQVLESALPNLESVNVYVFPNPVMDYLVVNGLEGKNAIEVYDMKGVLHKTLQMSGNNIQIAVDDLSEGVYLLRVNHYVVKFIKH